VKTFHLNETDLEWSLKHLLRFYSSDFFPKEFEFGPSEDGWSRFNSRTRDLAEEYEDGAVLICDFVDFYNQIYAHRLRNVIAEAGGTAFEEYAKVVEYFIHGLNDQTSRGIPVGPAASIVLAEVVLSDIERLHRFSTPCSTTVPSGSGTTKNISIEPRSSHGVRLRSRYVPKSLVSRISRKAFRRGSTRRLRECCG
jgi:hypothetical protein